MDGGTLERKLLEKQASSYGYDRLDLSSPRESEAIQKYVAAVRQSAHSGSVKAIIPMPNAHVSRSDGSLKGVVYVTDGTTPAYKLMTTRDLCGGVSIYRIASFVGLGGVSVEEHVRNKLLTIQDAPGWCDASLNLESLLFKGPSLGDINCSWGIFKSIVNEELEESWHLVIRSYHAPSSRTLYDIIHSHPEMTIKDVYDSKEYAQCLVNSDISRNAMAAVIQKHFGIRPEDIPSMERFADMNVPVAQPMETNRYNFIQRIPNFKGSLAYGYYHGCYGFSEQRVRMVAYGLDRSKGYTVMGYGSKVPQSFGTSDYGYGFPMGSPPSESIKDALQRKMGEAVRWGSTMVYHPKSLAGIHSHGYHEHGHGAECMGKLGVTSGMTRMKLVKKALYVSSPDPKSMSIEEIVDWSGTEVKMIAVPKSHDFIHTSLMHGYLCIYQKRRELKLHGDVIVGENEHVFYLSVTATKELIAVCRS